MSSSPSLREIGPDIRETLGVEPQPGARRRRVRRLALLALLAVGLAALGVWRWQAGGEAPRYRTAPVERRALVVQVSATGTLQPVNKVEVGSELSGVIRQVNVDYNARVKAGEVLAELDADRLRAQALQGQAMLESARARVLQASATVRETREQLERVRALVSRQISSQQDLVAAEAKHTRALAEEAVARADVSRAGAALNADRINLRKSVIRAPIDGVVLVRNVEPGQTVAASLQAPVLFVLAENLARMELLVDVDEADVGQVREEQSATFTVDAYPERTFEAQVKQVRYASETVAGVVTYKALLEVDNASLLLRPGMTATAAITVLTVPDALLVPNAALRFTPQTAETAERPGFWRRLLPRRTRPQPPAPAASPRERQRTVWTLRDSVPVAVPVHIGPTDGQATQVLEGTLEPGQALLVDRAEQTP